MIVSSSGIRRNNTSKAFLYIISELYRSTSNVQSIPKQWNKRTTCTLPFFLLLQWIQKEKPKEKLYSLDIHIFGTSGSIGYQHRVSGFKLVCWKDISIAARVDPFQEALASQHHLTTQTSTCSSVKSMNNGGRNSSIADFLIKPKSMECKSRIIYFVRMFGLA